MNKSGRTVYKTEKDYHTNTSKHMVSEPGRLPYDSRLYEDTVVPDNYNPQKEKVQFVEIYDEPTDIKSTSYDMNRLDHEWQKKWFKDHGNLNIRIKVRKTENDEKKILEQLKKYREDLGNFHRSDEYRKASDLMMEKHREETRVFHKRNEIRSALKNKTLTSISLDDAKELGWIIENDPKYKIYNSTKRPNLKYVYPNEFQESWTGEKKPLSKQSIWLGSTTVITPNDTKTGGKPKQAKKAKKTKKARKTKKAKKTKKVKKTIKKR